MDAGSKVDEIVRALKLILEPGQVTELRALDAVTATDKRPHVFGGYFDNLAKLAAAAAKIQQAKGIYFLPNPVKPALLARSMNKARAVGKDPTTADHDIVRRRFLLIDADAVRPAGIAASDAEHAAALERVLQVRDWLATAGWPAPIAADSGNGGHAVYAIDLPTDDNGLVKRCLEALAERFDDAVVKIDTSVHNPARIWKLYGTLAGKGDAEAAAIGRPHRLAKIIDAPDALQVVPVALLEALAASSTEKKTSGKQSKTSSANGSSFDLDAWFARHNLNLRGPEPWQGGQRWVFDVCPWNADHTNRSAFVIQQASGAIAAGCRHNGCAGKGWHELRDTIEPGWRDARQSPRAPGKSSDGPDDDLLVDDPWPEPLAEEAYSGLAGEVVRAIEPASEADPVALLAQVLVAIGSMIGRSAHFTAEADSHFGNLFTCMVGNTSKGRKGTSWGQVRRLAESVDEEWAGSHILGGLSSGEGLIWAVRDPIEKLEAVYEGKGKEKRVKEYQKVIVDEGLADKRLLVLESEFGSVLKVILRERNTLSAILRQAWDSGTLRTLTKNSPAKATGAHISIVGHITRDELRKLIAETDMANGLANRFLWLCVRRSKSLPESVSIPQSTLNSLAGRLKAAADRAKEVGKVERDEEAREIWRQVYPTLSAGKPGLLGAATSRAEAQVMRLALLYALLDSSCLIRPPHLMAALALWDYAERSARYVFGSSLGDPTADEILRALRDRPAGMTRTEIREFFGRNKPSQELARALGVLLEHGHARRQQETDTGGRPAERWFSVG